tara:strand:+ start:212 stop:907 length:696 start_codon:yes stop_codon:yes gene_type:complete
MTINLNKAAKYYKGEAHQITAWNYLESQLSEDLLDEFALLYRSQTPVLKEKIIDSSIMEKLTGRPSYAFNKTFCNDFNKLLALTGFDDHITAVAMLAANFMHETGNFKWLTEWADGSAYEFREDLGNTIKGDGPKYKGAGVLMLTGKYNYARCAEDLADPLILERGHKYVAAHYPFRSAKRWIEDNNLLRICLDEGFDQCCFKINGGWNGYQDRLAKYQKAITVFTVDLKD